ncbi:MGMT family protein [Vibrio sp. SS-MA-C1-2]|uniref:MGMT family protein n=1 Tax=Vibrio sp. SS-MA-C1-2 TaxID=2908646 RepID=UPI001F2F2AFB|nr:MGMT family protein [Vibrio sp. SS-MA-C1-2]UJF19875.1 MGMT family protein [Vibrio sp. SS-MA-C1-2]
MSLNHREFAEKIYATLNAIPFGKVTTYGTVSRLAGYPKHARHVGKLLANLPSNSSLPWYRVINSQGKISLTGVDFERQKTALIVEGITVSLEGKIKLKQYLWKIEDNGR